MHDIDDKDDKRRLHFVCLRLRFAASLSEKMGRGRVIFRSRPYHTAFSTSAPLAAPPRNGDEVLSSYVRRKCSLTMSREFGKTPDFCERRRMYTAAYESALTSATSPLPDLCKRLLFAPTKSGDHQDRVPVFFVDAVSMRA
jgi:hypothetical protein